MTAPGPVAVLGFQQGRPGTAAALAELNRQLAAGLAAPGLLDYQVVQDAARPERFCAYWLWGDRADREALWAAPPEPLRRFRAAAEPLWAAPPTVLRYRWEPAPPAAFCPDGGTVRLVPAVPPPPAAPEPPPPPGRLLAPAEPGAPAWVWQPGGTGPPAGGTTWHPCGSVPERLTT